MNPPGVVTAERLKGPFGGGEPGERTEPGVGTEPEARKASPKPVRCQPKSAAPPTPDGRNLRPTYPPPGEFVHKFMRAPAEMLRRTA